MCSCDKETVADHSEDFEALCCTTGACHSRFQKTVKIPQAQKTVEVPRHTRQLCRQANRRPSRQYTRWWKSLRVSVLTEW